MTIARTQTILRTRSGPDLRHDDLWFIIGTAIFGLRETPEGLSHGHRDISAPGQSSVEDIAHAQRIGRLRGFYLGVAPELDPYLLVVLGRRAETFLHDKRLRPSGWQLTLTTAGMVAVVNSVVIGASAGLLFETLSSGSLAVTLAAGAIIGASTLFVQQRHHRHASDAYRPEAVDRAAIFVPAAKQAAAA